MPWTSLHAKIHRTIRDRHLITQNQRLLVAVSGGQDSLCLIRLLLDLQSKWGWYISIAHCDHCWRADSAANAHHVENLAQSWQVPFHLATATEAINTEAAARNWRYQVLTEIAQASEYQYIVTGHTQSDRAETLLYNLMRGSGADGLQALAWQRPLTANIFLIRPLLAITRRETAQFCQDYQLPIWEDSTNQDTKYARNRIRQELLPYLRENFNPNLESALGQTAELLQADVEYLESIATELREKCFSAPTPDYIRINRRILQTVPLALQRRVMRQILLEVINIAPNFEHIEKLTGLIIAPNRTQTDPFPGGAIAQVMGDEILFLRNLSPK
ncbi:tRNA lysidine(34) synthetase TilS [Calothrix sp. 336/3]|uniref:tRNA lysidine(34) synthetase TilS n=1 Tax=Calothrix sp. 336/3 TaxID=1337936 RepID=UPI0004E30531|nr:tRNA lysidine(34) synthetase TilS [Calothrix sp. 336/3]AKG22472.1 tRNA(Ile)-lysidine synthase [Calothrix sp. 336/3]